MVRNSIWILLLLIFAFAFSVYGDTLYMKNGYSFEGKLIKEDEEKFTVEIDGIPYFFYKRDVDSIESEGVKREVSLEPTEVAEPVEPKVEVPTVEEPVVEDVVHKLSPDVEEAPTPKIELRPVEIKVPPTPTPYEGLLPKVPVLIPKGQAYQITGVGVNFRKGPSTSFDVVEQLSKSDILVGLKEEEGWIYGYSQNGNHGWMTKRYTTKLPDAPYLIKGDRVNMRSGPGTSYTSPGKMDKGDVVRLITEQDKWLKVRTVDNQIIWMYGTLLEKISSPSILEVPIRPGAVERNQWITLSPLESEGKQGLSVLCKESDIPRSGICSILALIKGKDNVEQLTSQIFPTSDYLNRYELPDNDSLREIMIVNDLARDYNGGVLGTVMGKYENKKWKFEVPLVINKDIDYFVVVQDGIARGEIIPLPQK